MSELDCPVPCFFLLLSSRFEGGKPEVIFSLHDQVLNAKPESSTADSSKPKPKIPKDHKFVLTGISSQSLSVLSVNPNAGKLVSFLGLGWQTNCMRVWRTY